MEAERYLSELKEAQHQLKQREADFQVLDLAKNHLIEENQALNVQLETVMQENVTKLEALEQDRYSLNFRLSQQLKMAESYQEEIECLRNQMASDRLSIIEQTQLDHMGRHAQLQKQINVLRADLEASQASEYEKAVKVKELEVALHHMQLERESRVIVTDTISSSDELDKILDELRTVTLQKDVLSQDCGELRNTMEQMKAKVEYLGNQLKSKELEAEENECRATSYYNTLEKTRGEVQELKMELELARMEANSTKKKGNSLFAEVEDRRVEAEKQLITVQVQNNALKKQVELLRQNLHQLKMQAAALLQMTGSKADSRHVQSLTQQLSQATGDLQMMTSQLHAALQESKSLKDRLVGLSSSGESSDGTNYIHYLQALLNRKETVVTALQQDLQTKRLLMLAESEKLMSCERRLYDCEQQFGAAQSQNVRLQLQLDELRLKHEPAAAVTGTVRRVKVEKIPKQIQLLTTSTTATSDPSTVNNEAIDCAAELPKEASKFAKSDSWSERPAESEKDSHRTVVDVDRKSRSVSVVSSELGSDAAAGSVDEDSLVGKMATQIKMAPLVELDDNYSRHPLSRGASSSGSSETSCREKLKLGAEEHDDKIITAKRNEKNDPRVRLVPVSATGDEGCKTQ